LEELSEEIYGEESQKKQGRETPLNKEAFNQERAGKSEEARGWRIATASSCEGNPQVAGTALVKESHQHKYVG
jgi:hypothetical protein